MKTKQELLAEGREVAERLRLTGANDQLKRKIEDLINAPAAAQHGGAMLKLANLLDAVAAAEPVPTVASAGMGAKGKAK